MLPNFYSTSSQKREWSDEPMSVVEHRPIDAIHNNQWANQADDDSTSDRKLRRCGCLSACPCLLGLMIGSLVAGLMLTVIIPLWLTPTTKAVDRSMGTSLGGSTIVGGFITTGGLTTTTQSTTWSSSTTSSMSTTTSTSTATISTSTSGSTATTSTTSSTSSTTSLTKPKTSTMSTTSTSTTSTSTTTSTTMTTQNPTLASFNKNNLTTNSWTLWTYSYMAAVTGTVTLEFELVAAYKFNWYLDDVSVKDSALVEMITNGNYESSPSLTGWNTGSTGGCGTFGISSTQSHSTNQSFYTMCQGQTVSISQSFPTTAAQVYSVTFWVYLLYTNGGAGSNPILKVMVQ